VARREVLRRVVEFEDFSRCWPDDQLVAEGLVARVRAVINVKGQLHEAPSGTRPGTAGPPGATGRAAAAEAAEVRAAREGRPHGPVGVFAETNPQRRGIRLEQALNDVFQSAGLHVQDAFIRRAPDGGALEQVDGVVVVDGTRPSSR
jgi:hypothetical protein